ncbi:hypothetical protein GCM10017655_47900 [Pseudomonas turukhanskensis]|uniref:Uncharacterized protein n=1 Tax=Pseudomonas turukhanskensis TaxID=1806536 RepID=A0A9W6K953_9PSED|nr:hypothetical protein GCM10017655_47900 [Pseudomonas turukhanskensis]
MHKLGQSCPIIVSLIKRLKHSPHTRISSLRHFQTQQPPDLLTNQLSRYLRRFK